jgi:aldehyde dehydrogenase (NAD+)
MNGSFLQKPTTNMSSLQTPSLEEIQRHYQVKRTFFDSGATKPITFRIEQLKKFRAAIEKYEDEIIAALHADMRKPRFEAFVSEIGIMYEEIDHTIKHLDDWMQPEKVSTPMVLHPSGSYIYKEPLGVVLIIGPWNYPFQLLMAPLVGAIAAGNCAVIKPSNETEHTALVTEKLVRETFDEDYISVVQGPGSKTGPLLIENNRFDHIFFTGSPGVGSMIAGMAAKHLTPVTLELGGKSPAIVDKDVNLEVAAKRLIWAKFFNAGQTCVCPDYLLVHADVKAQFVAELQKNINIFFGENPKISPHFARIVNDKRFAVLTKLLENAQIIAGGVTDAAERYIPLMQEEIFGPILPILTWKNREEVVQIVRQHRFPLACYIFTSDDQMADYFIERLEFGGGCVNNCMAHLANPDLPFGGVGFSGMGRYHGRHSFEAMSHTKSVLKTATWLDPSLRYPPYSDKKLKWAEFFFN